MWPDGSPVAPGGRSWCVQGVQGVKGAHTASGEGRAAGAETGGSGVEAGVKSMVAGASECHGMGAGGGGEGDLQEWALPLPVSGEIE